MERKIEFKLKVTKTPWNQLPIMENGTAYGETWNELVKDADSKARFLAKSYGCECRWNVAGLNQGHYISHQIFVK